MFQNDVTRWIWNFWVAIANKTCLPGTVALLIIFCVRKDNQGPVQFSFEKIARFNPCMEDLARMAPADWRCNPELLIYKILLLATMIINHWLKLYVSIPTHIILFDVCTCCRNVPQ